MTLQESTLQVESQPRLLAPSDLIGSREVAEILNITIASVTRRVQRGALVPFVKLGGPVGAYVFDRNDIQAQVKK